MVGDKRKALYLLHGRLGDLTTKQVGLQLQQKRRAGHSWGWGRLWSGGGPTCLDIKPQQYRGTFKAFTWGKKWKYFPSVHYSNKRLRIQIKMVNVKAKIFMTSCTRGTTYVISNESNTYASRLMPHFTTLFFRELSLLDQEKQGVKKSLATAMNYQAHETQGALGRAPFTHFSKTPNKSSILLSVVWIKLQLLKI